MRDAAADLGRRAAEYFIAPRDEGPRGAQVTQLVTAAPPGAMPRTATTPPAVRLPPRVAVVGRRSEAIPVAAAIANALRVQEDAPSAALAVWAPPATSRAPTTGHDTSSPTATHDAPYPAGVHDARYPAGVHDARPTATIHDARPTTTTHDARATHGARPPVATRDARPPTATHDARPPAAPAASRLAARLTARGLGATARGRLAWVALDDHPVAAAHAVRRVAASVDVPVVTVLAGPRSPVLEAVLREQDLVAVVTCDPGGPLGRLAVATSEVPAVACAPLTGPARLLGAAGLAGARVLDDRTRAALERVGAPLPLALIPRGARR